MSLKTYQISELAKLAGVTVRTIRYYISQGLLPSPSTSGQFDRYDESYLARLELIRRLKAEYLPLEKISALLNSMSDAAIQAELDHPNPQPATPGSAREYVRSILYPSENVSLNKRLAKSILEPHVEPGAGFTAFQQSPQALKSARGQTSAPTTSTINETWLRYRIHPDIELHIRDRPMNPLVKDRLPKLLIELDRLCYLLELNEEENQNE
jgi:DNA-binding transcriptional MerR regulator